MQSEEVDEEVVAEDPLRHLLSDTDSDPKERHQQVHVNDEGSRPHFARVELQGVPMHGVLDTGEDMTIMNGPMFKQVLRYY